MIPDPMHTEYAYVEKAPRDGDAEVAVAGRRHEIDGFDLAVLAGFACVSAWVLGLDVWQVIAHGRVWTGTDGSYVVDQMQYLAWINDASRHVLSSNMFVLRPTPADYLHPAIAISGAIAALGVAPWIAYMLWKPVAVLALFFAVRAFAHRSLAERSARRAALVLGLFFGSFTFVYGSFGVVGDLLPGYLSWGYPFGLVALAAMLLALLAYDRARGAGRLVWTAPLLGALASSLHPWQGETLILIVIGVEAMSLRRDSEHLRSRTVMAAATVTATAIPLVYYVILGRTDLSWRLARSASHHSFSLGTILLALAPILVLAALGYRGRSHGFLATATRAWPLAALAIFLVSGTTVSATPLHAFDGVTVPLAVLAVDGVRRIPWERGPRGRLLAWLAIAVATIPATVYELAAVRPLVAPAAGNPNFITHDERRALEYLATNREPGGVLTRFYLGTVVPSQTSRQTFVGDCLWSEPGCAKRAKLAQQLIEGSLTARAARSFVSATGARFVLADCTAGDGLRNAIASITASVHEFGCASVYQVARPVAANPPVADTR